MKVRTNMLKNTTDITEIDFDSLGSIMQGLEVLMEQWPCRASKLRSDHPDRIQLAKIEAMYLVLGGKLSS